MITKLNIVRQLIKLGISVIPLHHRSKKPMLKSWRPYTEYLATEQEVSTWLGSNWCNYGVVCGWENLVVIDFDDMEMFDLWSMWVGTRGTDTQYVFNTSFKVRTARGMHVYVTSFERVENSKRRHIDIQATNKYVVGPGSVHPSGHVYEPIGDLVFPVVFDLEEILPLDLFPLVANGGGSYNGAPMEFAKIDTQYDPFAAASMGSGVDLIAKVKASVRIESLFSDLRKTSADARWLATWCPFHTDKRPGGTMSFWIDTARQLCGCQVCGMKPLDVINLYAKMHNVSDSAAVRAMAEELGVWR